MPGSSDADSPRVDSFGEGPSDSGWAAGAKAIMEAVFAVLMLLMSAITVVMFVAIVAY